MPAPLTVLRTPADIGEHLAERILHAIADAHADGRPFVLGSPTGRTPRPIYEAMARRLGERPQDLSHVTVAMMDEYLVEGATGLEYAPADAAWSCHWFARVEIAERLNSAVRPEHRLQHSSIWFPLAGNPAEYEARIARHGIDLFLLASGASDGHVAFNPPGSARDSRTRIIPLSDDTRRDNLATFPAFGTLDSVPHHGVSVGIATIVESRAAVMVAWGEGKRETVARMRAVTSYDASWPATLIHECRAREIVVDQAAATAA